VVIGILAKAGRHNIENSQAEQTGLDAPGVPSTAIHLLSFLNDSQPTIPIEE
jgi:hypothetical protein